MNVQKIFNLKANVVSGNQVYLSWDFKNKNTSIGIKYQVQRNQITDGGFITIAITRNKTFTDINAVPFIPVQYKVRAIIEWEGQELPTEYTIPYSLLLCENNTFPYGRYNNTTGNQNYIKFN